MIKNLGIGQKIYAGIVVLLLGWYGIAEARGWASGGTKRSPLSKKQLRQSNLGYRTPLIFWYHGYRGK